MKYLFLIIFILTSPRLLSQINENLQTNHFNYCYMIAKDDKLNEIVTPWGNNVFLHFDKFYKKFILTYDDKSSRRSITKLEFITEFEDYWLMKDHNGVKFYVYNDLNNGHFVFVMTEKQNGLIIGFELTDSLRE